MTQTTEVLHGSHAAAPAVTVIPMGAALARR